MKEDVDWRYQADVFPEQWKDLVATVNKFLKDKKQSLPDVLGMVSQGVDHPRVY
jgi:carbonic anhydrase